jgi:hypothetical protein
MPKNTMNILIHMTIQINNRYVPEKVRDELASRAALTQSGVEHRHDT